MSLSYNAIGSNHHGLSRILVLKAANNFRLPGVVSGSYHPALCRVVAGFDVEQNREVPVEGAKWLLTVAGFVISRHDYEAFAVEHQLQALAVAGSQQSRPQDILELAKNDRVRALNLLQHLLLVFRPEVPSFVQICLNNIAVSHAAVLVAEEAANIVSSPLPNGKGYRFSSVLPDGFILAEHVASVMIEVNTDLDVAQKQAVEECRRAAKNKLYELMGWEMRQWMMEMLLKPIHNVLPIDLYDMVKADPEPFSYQAPVVSNPSAC